MKLSIVATLFESAPFIGEFCDRASAAAESLVGPSFEIVLVNDGSTDDSLQQALLLQKRSEHLRVVDLTRNFGHHPAMLCGLAQSRGDRVFLIDSDLEEDPALLTFFWERLDACPDVDVVYGVQAARKGGLFEHWSGSFFYKTFNALSDVPIPSNFLTVRLMSRRYVDELVRYDERVMQFSVLSELAGYKKVEVQVDKRDKGSSAYTMGKKLAHLTDAITSTSIKPLIWMFKLGLLITLASMSYSGWVIFKALTGVSAVDGWASLIVSVWFLGGVIMMSLGIVGIYMAKIFLEVKKRPNFAVKSVHEPGTSRDFNRQ